MTGSICSMASTLTGPSFALEIGGGRTTYVLVRTAGCRPAPRGGNREEREGKGWWQLMTNALVPCDRCGGRTAALPEGNSPLQSLVEKTAGYWRTTRLILCQECLAELQAIIDRADNGESEAKRELERELAELSVSLDIDELE
jgi:hypothetical protein